jgi:phage terminase large subunit
MKSSSVTFDIPKAFAAELLKSKRYKIFWGGRGSGKSWAIADALLAQGIAQPLRILCARELQNSIADSVHKLLSDRIRSKRLTGHYRVLKGGIRGRNGTEFLFKGLRHNVSEIKSTEGIDRVWIEEAEKVSHNSWELLIPTIRKEGSEIWISFNAKNPTDATYRLFVERPRGDAVVKKVSYRDNPFFPEVLEKERVELLKTDPEAYQHIWEGDFDTRFFGGVYSNHIRVEQVVEDAFDPSLPVHTAWDLGYDDATAIWFWQAAGAETRVIDYYENSGQDIAHYCSVLAARHYDYGRHYVPHDAAYKLLAAGGKSIVEQAFALGVRMFVVKASSQQNQVEAARLTLRDAWFSQACAKGLEALRQYRFEYDEGRKVFKSTPLHDWSSHAADAFEIIAAVRRGQAAETPPDRPKFLHEATADEVFWPDIETTEDERI